MTGIDRPPGGTVATGGNVRAYVAKATYLHGPNPPGLATHAILDGTYDALAVQTEVTWTEFYLYTHPEDRPCTYCQGPDTMALLNADGCFGP